VVFDTQRHLISFSTKNKFAVSVYLGLIYYVKQIFKCWVYPKPIKNKKDNTAAVLSKIHHDY